MNMKKHIKNIILLYFFVLYSSFITHSQTMQEQSAANINNKVRTSLFLIPSLHFASHSAGFSSFGGCENCVSFDKTGFTDASGINYNASIGIEHHFTDVFAIQGRIGFQNNSVTFNTGPKFLTWANINGSEPQAVYAEHTLDIVNSMISIQVLPSLIIANKLSMSFGLAGFLNINPTFSYKESLIDASGQLSYSETSLIKERNVYPEGSTFENPQSFIIGLNPTVSYKIPLTSSLTFEPEFSYFMSVNDMLKDANWKYGSVNMGIKVHFLSLSHFSPNQCPDGMMLDSYGNCIDIPQPCPSGFIRNPAGDCVPICPDGYVYNSVLNDCIQKNKCPDGFAPNQLGNCEKICKPGYLFDASIQDCKLTIPIVDKSCKGAYLSVQFNEKTRAEEFLKDIQSLLGENTMYVVKVQDEIDNRVVVYSVQTGCYDDSNIATTVSRELYEVIDGKLGEKYNNIKILLKGTR